MGTEGQTATGAPVIVERPRPGVVLLRMNRPDQLNAMNHDLVDALHTELDRLGNDLETRVVVLTGAGRGFCSGLDLGGYGQIPGAEQLGTTQQSYLLQSRIALLVQKIRRLPQVFVAAVNGPAAGGGLALVCACDVRLAASEAIFAVSFIRIGVSGCDIGVSWLLPRLVGAGRAHELMLTARRFGADEALRIGLLADAVPGSELRARVDATIDDLLTAPPMSLSLTKRGMWLALETPGFDTSVELENRQQSLTFGTADQQEAMAAYIERRAPEYHNR
ncbi:enoyl-CoA hydratase/isomerase family protein [Aldersonia sp. NBC_00410]|uniref:enoyl-CoA hydratase/isomerase family protein n=1 Tax=Aldersonia sp. NBC_00410 TaxID=2975954 RepID=UPI002259DF31|nr:enoyl-CoA hydratase/isomerase family protein [Aldersonia sp. NBC_00410]MCX5041882.1 enoyl-CoA hydratase/isomerase family protein [Aldersonia sp. NBC_00410]